MIGYTHYMAGRTPAVRVLLLHAAIIVSLTESLYSYSFDRFRMVAMTTREAFCSLRAIVCALNIQLLQT